MRSRQGFTLIELMIAVVVIAILAAIAVPSYRSYVLRAQRTDATSALLRVRNAQDKFFLQNRRYMDPAGVTAGGLDASERGYYTIVSAVPDPDRPGMLSFKLTAAPVAGAPRPLIQSARASRSTTPAPKAPPRPGGEVLEVKEAESVRFSGEPLPEFAASSAD